MQTATSIVGERVGGDNRLGFGSSRRWCFADLGISGALGSALTALEPYRPFFVG